MLNAGFHGIMGNSARKPRKQGRKSSVAPSKVVTSQIKIQKVAKGDGNTRHMTGLGIM
jgi:hypothetical protein